MSTVYRVFLYSSDLGRLTFESDHPTREEAMAVVEGWCREDPEEEHERGLWDIQERLNNHLRGVYVAYAHAYPHERRSERNAGAVENETIEQFNERSMARQLDMQRRSKQLISHEEFPTREAAQLAVDKAVDACALDLDERLYGRIQRQQRAAGIHQRFISDLIPFGYRVYQGECGPKFKLAADTTIEELRALRFPEGLGRKSREEQFTVESGALRATDPCYSMDTWCAGTVNNVANGTWFAHTQQYHEGQCEWSKERFEKALVEFAKSDDEPLNDELAKGLEAAIAAEPDEEKRQKLRDRIQRLMQFRNNNKLREFSEQYGNPDDWRGRIAYLHIRHESVRNEPIDPFSFVKNEELNVGVDSGQAGFFDLAKFELVAADKEHKDTPEHEDFYEACGEKTLGFESWGTVQGMGAVSSSGYGDGGYTLCERRNEAGELIEARIVYLLEGSEMFPGIGGDDEDDE